MKSIYIAGGCKGNTAVNILKGHLEAKGHRVTRDAKDPLGWDVTVRWGISYQGNKPALNAGVNQFDKLGAMFQFIRNKIRTPYPHTDFEDYVNLDKGQIVLARNVHHVKGKDIVVCKTLKDVRAAAHNKDFFVAWIPTQTEYRVWVFRDRVFGIYEKVYKGEGEYEGFMRNRRFGFKFDKRDNLRGMNELEAPCVKAVKSLGLDFGAVDLLLGKDGKFYVLENNTMPHVDSPKRSTGIRLANLVSDWAEAQ
jgi:hypothetical protein